MSRYDDQCDDAYERWRQEQVDSKCGREAIVTRNFCGHTFQYPNGAKEFVSFARSVAISSDVSYTALKK